MRKDQITSSFLEENLVYVPRFRTIAFADSDLPGSADDIRDRHENVVHNGDEKQQNGDYGQDEDQIPDRRLRAVLLGQRSEEVPKCGSVLLQLIQRLVSLLHLVNGILKGRRINAFSQFHKSDVAIVAKPVGKAPRAHRLNGQDDIRMNGSVLRKVFVNSTYCKFPFRHLIVGDLLADSLVDSAKFLGE